MCLLITMAFAAVFYVLMRLDKDGRFMVRPVFITYFSAAIMWVVDGIWRVFGGEEFWDMEEGETALGFTVGAFGLLLWFALLGLKAVSARKAQA